MEAGKYDVLPLDDRSCRAPRRPAQALDSPRADLQLLPGHLTLPEFAAAELRGRSFKILAQVELDDAAAEGVIFAQGARFGGHSLFVKDRKLWYAYNFIGIPPEQQLVSPDELTAGHHVLGVEFVKESR